MLALQANIEQNPFYGRLYAPSAYAELSLCESVVAHFFICDSNYLDEGFLNLILVTSNHVECYASATKRGSVA